MSEIRTYVDKGTQRAGCTEKVTVLSDGRFRVDSFRGAVRQTTSLYTPSEMEAHLASIKSLQSSKVIFEDSFLTLDPSKWKAEPTNSPPNNELQAFTSRPENISIQNGMLALIARKESYGGKNYTSGKVITKDLFDFTYGRVEARMKVPAGKGIWTAFWGMGKDVWDVGWPQCGEFDIVEVINGDETAVGSLHAPNYDKSIWKKYPGLHQDFHIFSMDWSPGVFTWAVDGDVYARQERSAPFNHPFYLLLTLSVGGNWPGPPDATTTFPTTLLVDWVRVTNET